MPVDNVKHLTTEELQAGLGLICESPKDAGMLETIVRRPSIDGREVLYEAMLDVRNGLEGDTWTSRSSSRTADGSPHPDMQLTLMNARAIALLAQTQERWALAGDQLFIDLDLSFANLPAGALLEIGQAVVEITDQPHAGCPKFAARFGREALLFVNGPEHRHLRLRGIYAKVIQSGAIKTGHMVKVIARPAS